jgi:hypothetical protein
MNWRSEDVLSVLDKCCDAFTFPMLDNGYVYLSATRLSLYRSEQDWAIAIEVFGFSPRSGVPDTQIYTFGSRLLRSKSSADFASPQAFAAYVANNPNNESTFVFPVDDGDWLDADNPEVLADGEHTVLVRRNPIRTPAPTEYAAKGIILENSSEVQVYEFCRWLAASHRDSVLATPEERRSCIPSDLIQVLQLEEWSHPDVVNDERPSSNQTFRSLADVLISGDVSRYEPAGAPNTHWENWPDGGTL